MEETLYLECYFGITGEMLIEALLDLGVDHQKIEKLQNNDMISCLIKDINEIARLEISERAKMLALKICELLKEPEEEELRQILTIAVCVDALNITDIILLEIYEGKGIVKQGEKFYPVPIPEVLELLQKCDLPIHIAEYDGELITRVGAAAAGGLCTKKQLPKHFVIKKTGVGKGDAGILRAMLIETETQAHKQIQNLEETDEIWKLESNIDDCSGEIFGYVLEQLMGAGARDVHYIPVFMKKNRPAWILTVLCAEKDIPKMEEILFRETTTIGIRRQKMQRTIMRREKGIVETVFGPAEVKICKRAEQAYIYPEYESAAKISREYQVPLQEVYRQIQLAAALKYKNE